MREYKVNADFIINVETFVEADSFEEAERKAIFEILNKNCEWLDPCCAPKVRWIETVENEFQGYLE